MCECKESFYEGLSCRHELAVYVLTDKDFEKLHFNTRWEINYFVPKNVEEEQDKQELHVENHQVIATLIYLA